MSNSLSSLKATVADQQRETGAALRELSYESKVKQQVLDVAVNITIS